MIKIFLIIAYVCTLEFNYVVVTGVQEVTTVIIMKMCCSNKIWRQWIYPFTTKHNTWLWI